MRILVAMSVVIVLAAAVFAQQANAPATDMTKGMYRSAADVAAAVAKLGKTQLESAPIFKMGRTT